MWWCAFNSDHACTAAPALIILKNRIWPTVEKDWEPLVHIKDTVASLERET